MTELNKKLHNTPQEKLEDIVQDLQAMVHSLRMLSLNVVEAIMRWKEQMLHSMLLADK